MDAQLNTTTPKILFVWTKDGVVSAVSPTPTYAVYNPSGTSIASGTLTADSANRYPYAVPGNLLTEYDSYEVRAVTTDPAVDNALLQEIVVVKLLTAAAFAANAITASALATDAVNEIAAAVGGASASDIADAVLDEALSGHTTAGSTGAALTAIKAKTDAIVVSAVRYANSYDPKTRKLTIVRGNTPTILFEGLSDDWTGATDITLGIRQLGAENTEPLLEIAGSVYSSSALRVVFPAGFGVSPELTPGENNYEWDLTGQLASGEIKTPIRKSPLVLIDRIARVS